jgi:hypothetical protein
MDSTGSEKPTSPPIDEHWLQQWVAFGMLDIAVYLTRYAAFLKYCEHRERTGRL